MVYAGVVYACVVVSLYIVETTSNSKHLRTEGFVPVHARKVTSPLFQKNPLENKMCYLKSKSVNASTVAFQKKQKLFQRMKGNLRAASKQNQEPVSATANA